ncbi:MAG: tRNA lysidine(34) synthetase TilS [Phycisphaerae bacterium]|nr:tRNA lysidine(34) synthetase TilS [Phycisphaerae bacterium]
MERTLRTAVRKDPAARKVIAAWRRLTGGSEMRDKDRRTLIACSGGADSSALAIILAAATDNLTVCHILHDLRPEKAAKADRDTARRLTRTLGLPFTSRSAAVLRLPGNAEANARVIRYELLARVARAKGCVAIATAHHADDQAETVLMRLIRGSGPAGLRGVRESRPGPLRLRIVRPMLGVSRDDAERICRIAGHRWATDATNTDTTRLRAAVRARVLPVLRELSPNVSLALTRAAVVQADAALLIRQRAKALVAAARQRESGLELPGKLLSRQPAAVLVQLIRVMYHRVVGTEGARSLTGMTLAPVLRAVRARSPRRVVITVGRCRFEATPTRLAVRPLPPA